MLISYRKYKKLLDHSNHMTECFFAEERKRKQQAEQFDAALGKAIFEKNEYKKMYYDEFQKRIELLNTIRQGEEKAKLVEEYLKLTNISGKTATEREGG
jgi:glycyl-tRNA synthetase beta subunit